MIEFDRRSPGELPGAFRRARLRILFATMFCYLFYYTGRQTFGFAIPGIERELGLSKTQLGWTSAALLWSYAAGQAINGNLGDKFGGRRLMSLGAVLSCGLNWVLSFGTGLWSLIVPWSLNGYAQSMGWAPGSRVLSNWWGPEERGRVYGLYVFAAGMASVLAFVTSLLVLELDWRWIFRLPVLLMLVGAAVFYLVARDRPEDLGFSSDLADTDGARAAPPEEAIAERSVDRYGAVLRNWRFMTASVAIGFQNLARYGLLVWVPVHFLGADWKSSGSGWVAVALPVGMALGAVTSGWMSDVLLGANRSRVITTFMMLAAACSLGMYALPENHAAGVSLLFLCGFFTYGPQSAFWALSPDLLGTRRAGTGVGVMNTFAYAFAGLGEPLIGWIIEKEGETSLVFAVVAAACLAGGLIAALIRR